MIWNNCELFLQTKHLEYDRSGELLSFHPFIVDSSTNIAINLKIMYKYLHIFVEKLYF